MLRQAKKAHGAGACRWHKYERQLLHRHQYQPKHCVGNKLQQILLMVVYDIVFGGHCHLRLQERPGEVLTAGLVNWGGGQSGAPGCLHRPMKTAACLQDSIITISMSLSCYSHSPADPAHESLSGAVLCKCTLLAHGLSQQVTVLLLTVLTTVASI